MIGRLFICLLAMSPAFCAGDFAFLKKGASGGPPIILPADAASLTTGAAMDLAEHLGAATGASFPVLQEGFAYTRTLERRYRRSGVIPAVYLGGCAANQAFVERLGKESDPSAYYIAVDPEGVHLVGKTPEATEFAVYDFLRRYLDIHFFAPGEIGREIPKLEEVGLPLVRRLEKPAFSSRFLSARGDAGYGPWTRANRLWRRHRFHHALDRLLEAAPPERVREFLPEGEKNATDLAKVQPDLANEDFIAHVAETVSRTFNPDAPSFEISPNDNVAFGEGAFQDFVAAGAPYFRNRPDYSDRVFGFANAVAERVRFANPAQRLGFIAYFWWLAPPSFPVDDRLMVYVCVDRQQWYDPRRKRADLALQRAWRRKANEPRGMYDFIYGQPYLIPRGSTRYLAGSMRAAANQGYDGYYAEIYPWWPFDAPKAWLASQLAWNPYADPERLLDEFFAKYYGPAATSMAAFHSACERVWESQPGEAEWIRFYQNESQANLYPPEVCEALEKHLASASRLAVDGKVAERVASVVAAFEVTKLFSRYYARKVQLYASGRHNDEALLEALDDYLRLSAELRRTLGELKTAEPHMRFGASTGYIFAADPAPSIVVELWRRARSSQERQRLAAVVEGYAELERLVGDLAAGALTRNLLPEAEFDTSFAVVAPENYYGIWGSELSVAGWEADFRPASQLKLYYEHDENGRGGIRIKGSEEGHLHRSFGCVPGIWYTFSWRIAAAVSLPCEVRLELRWRDAAGKRMGRSVSNRLPPGAITGETFRVVGQAPDRAKYVQVLVTVRRQARGDFVTLSSPELSVVVAQSAGQE